MTNTGFTLKENASESGANVESFSPIPGVVIIGGAHGTLALARSIGAQGVPVSYVTHDMPLPGLSRFIKETVRWPGPHDADALSRLVDMASRPNWKGRLLVPAGDAEIQLVAENHAALAPVYKLFLPAWNELKWLCSKPLLYRRAAELGLSTPLTYELDPTEKSAIPEVAFPVVLKPGMGGGNGQIYRDKVIRVNDRSSLELAYRDAVEQIGVKNVVVQELIPGGGESQFSYAALWNRGAPVAEFSARRTRQYPVDFGYTSTCVEVIDEPHVVEAARTILKSVGHTGLVEIEFKRDPRDKSLKLLDINPRPWSWFGLCSTAGVDLGAMLLKLANNQEIAPAMPKIGTTWVYLIRDFMAAVRLMLRGDIGISDYLASLKRARCWATFSLNDPLPGLADIPLTAWRVLTRRMFHLG